MPFGFVTKAQLEAHAEDLRREIAEARADQERVMKRIALEWEEWWEKFSRLYARLSKRVKDASRETGLAEPNGGEGGAESTESRKTTAISPEKLAAWRSRRGF